MAPSGPFTAKLLRVTRSWTPAVGCLPLSGLGGAEVLLQVEPVHRCGVCGNLAGAGDEAVAAEVAGVDRSSVVVARTW